jgi:hypothetical protein
MGKYMLLYVFLTSALSGCERVNKERPLDTHFIGGMTRPRAGLNVVAQRKIPVRN